MSFPAHRPPRLAERLLELTVPAEDRDAILGDLDEALTAGERAFPRLWYWAQAILFAIAFSAERLRKRLRHGRRPGTEASTGRASRGGGIDMSGWLREMRITARSLVRRPGFVATCVLTLALGIGANTAVFSVINAALLQPLPFPEPDRIVWLSEWWKDQSEPGGSSMNAANFEDLRASVTTLQSMSPYVFYSANLSGGETPERVSGLAVGHAFFDALGVQPILGRGFTRDDDVPDAPPVAILTYELWRSRFGSDPGIIGRDVRMDGEPHTVIGILPAGTLFPGGPRLFVPLGFEGQVHGRGGRQLNGIARLAPGTTLATAREELTAAYAKLEAEYPNQNENWSAWADPLRRLIVPQSQAQGLRLLAWSVGLVFLVACINLVNLLLVRAETRQREIAVRVALGAGRMRLVPHFVGETLMLSLAGGTAGLLVAYVGVGIMRNVFGGMLPRSNLIGLDTSVVAFAIALSLVAGVLAGLFPILHTDLGDLQSELKDGARGASTVGSRIRRVLVVGELGVAVVLLVTAGLLVRSFYRVASIDVGIADPEHVLVARLSLPAARYPTPQERIGFFHELVEQVEAQPSVVSAGLTSRLPLYGGSNFTKVPVVGDPDRFANFVEWRVVTPGFFDAVGVRLEEGRMMGPEDAAADTLRTIMVNRELARQLFGDRSAVGQRIDVFGDGVGLEVIGVVSDLRDLGHERPKPPGVYAPYGPTTSNTDVILLARTAGDPIATLTPLRSILSRMDSELPVYGTRTLQDVVDQRLGGRRFSIVLLSIFAGLAVMLGAIGIYGVMSYAVTQRTREMGVRLALGARRSAVVRLVLRRGAGMTALGLALGLAGSFGAAYLVRTQLFEVGTNDPFTYVVVTAVLGGVSMLASYLPARRASATDPLEALRHE